MSACDPALAALSNSPADAERRLTARIFGAFLALHVLLWTAIPAIVIPNMPLDMTEMVYWGRQWQWGYSKHPPLPAWIAAAVFELSRGAHWPLFLAGQLAVATSFWAAWKLAGKYLRPWPALCSAVLLEACANYNLMTADLNNSIVLQPLWALAVLCLYQAVTGDKWRYWIATGVCLGCGMLAKYDTATLVVAMLTLPLINRRARACCSTIGPFLTLAVSLVIFAPHVVWGWSHDFPTVQYAMERSENARNWLGHVANPLEFLLAQMLALLPMTAVAWPLWRKRRDSQAARPSQDELNQDFLRVVCFGPLALDLLISVVTGIKLQSMWGAPMWTFAGLALLCQLRPVDVRVYRTVAWRCVAVGCCILIIVSARNLVVPHFRGKASRVHYPGAELSQVIQDIWREHADRPLAVIAGSWWPVANVGLNAQEQMRMYDFFEPQSSPWANDATLREHGGMIVWEADIEDEKRTREVAERFPNAVLLPVVSINYQTTAHVPPAQLRAAVVLAERPQIAREETGTRLR